MQRRISPAAAHVAPLLVFELFIVLAGWIAIHHPGLPWWHRAPEQWLYPLQTVGVGAMLLYFREFYRLRPWRGLPGAVVLGCLGVVCWVAPAFTGEKLTEHGVASQAWWEWLGLSPRLHGFDPSFFQQHTFWYFSAIGLRFIRLVIIAPWVEEIFWRSFLMRYVIADDEYAFVEVPFGTHSWKAFSITTFGVVIVHQRADWLGALVFGSLMYWLAVRTKSLGACILMHAVANLLLGIYVMTTKQWGFW